MDEKASLDEISYSTGKLGKKIGVSRTTIVKHLKESGLIDECYTTPRGHIRIPYSVAARIAAPEALAVSTPTPTTLAIVKVPRGRKLLNPDQQRKKEIPPPPQPPQPSYAQIGRMLRVAGVSMADLIKYIEQQMQTASPSSHQTQNAAHTKQIDEDLVIDSEISKSEVTN